MVIAALKEENKRWREYEYDETGGPIPKDKM